MTKSKKKPAVTGESTRTAKQLPAITECSNEHEKGLIWVDPIYIRFQHSKIRPVFSSCGRTLMETLNSIRQNEIKSVDLPQILVRYDAMTF
jgi:hypothetical protein